MSTQHDGGRATAEQVVRDLMSLTAPERAGVLSFMRSWCDECGRLYFDESGSLADGHWVDDHDHWNCENPNVEALRSHDALVSVLGGDIGDAR